MTLWIGTDRGLFCDGDPVKTLPEDRIKCLAADEGIWAATDAELWRLTDEWRAVASFPAGVRPRCLLPTDAGLLIGTSGAEVYRCREARIDRDESFSRLGTRPQWHTPWGGPPSTWSMCAGANGDLLSLIHI